MYKTIILVVSISLFIIFSGCSNIKDKPVANIPVSQAEPVSYVDLDEIPVDYTPEEAVSDGCYVIVATGDNSSAALFGGEEYWNTFLTYSEKGEDVSLRIATFLSEETAYEDILYKDGLYYHYFRNGDGELVTTTYQYLRTLQGEFGSPRRPHTIYALTDSLELTHDDVIWSFISSNTSSVTTIPFDWLSFTVYLELDNESPPSNEQLKVIAPESELKVTSSEKQVDEFLGSLKEISTGYEDDICYNITPDYIAKNSEYRVFKYDKSTVSFLLADSSAYMLGESFGGYGVTGMALADLNEDNLYEFYFTFSWGSGLHRSQIGYFDPATKEVTIFDYSHMNYDMMLTTNEDGELLVQEASIDNGTFVDYTMTAGELVGRIELVDGKISLKLVETE